MTQTAIVGALPELRIRITLMVVERWLWPIVSCSWPDNTRITSAKRFVGLMRPGRGCGLRSGPSVRLGR
jgi:hypothetical protein